LAKIRRQILNIRNKKDFGAGIMYMVFGLFFALNALNYKMGTAAKMGPGYFPFWLGALLTALGRQSPSQRLG